MTEPNREAAKAARDALKGCGHDVPLPHLNAALAVFQAHLRPPAALPFLAPQPNVDADEIACNLLDICPSQWPISPRRARYRDMIDAALAAVRAEATLAGAAAEKEAIANWIDETSGWDEPSATAAAIRARKWT